MTADDLLAALPPALASEVRLGGGAWTELVVVLRQDGDVPVLELLVLLAGLRPYLPRLRRRIGVELIATVPAAGENARRSVPPALLAQLVREDVAGIARELDLLAAEVPPPDLPLPGGARPRPDSARWLWLPGKR